ncbi:MAG: hypothetical protein DMD79_19370, partial [Candidatus Rokuibacteriota bacterium]
MGGASGDGQPTLAAIAETAARLCHATEALIYRTEGAQLRLVARHGSRRARRASGEMHPITRSTIHGRAVLDRRTIRAGAAVAGPMLRDGAPVGVIVVRRPKVRPFSNEQISLLEMFAVQAGVVIQELDARSRELIESLEQQAATGEILRVISSSPTDVQPVFDAIVRSAVRLCGALVSCVFRFDGELIHFVGHHNFPPEGLKVYQHTYPLPPAEDKLLGQALLERRPVNVSDVLAQFRSQIGQRE